MDNRLNLLKQNKCNIDNAMNRFMGDEEFLLECIEMTLQDENFNILYQSIKEENVQKAFEAAHALKGICGNTGLTPIYEGLFPIVEVLRKGKMTGLEQAISVLFHQRESIIKLIREG